MKIGIVFYKYPLYPGGSYFQEYLNELAKSSKEIFLLATPYPSGKFYQPKNLKIFWLPFLNASYVKEFLFMFEALFKVILNEEWQEIDLFNCVGLRGVLAGWYLKKRFKIPLVCTIEMLNEKGTFFNNLYYDFARFLLTKAPVDKFICWSTYYWENHLKKWGIEKEKVEIIPAGIDLKTYHPKVNGQSIKKKYSSGFPLIVFAKPLYSANTQAAKTLIKAIALLQPKIKTILLIGSGEGKSEIQKLAAQLKISTQVKFMPPTLFSEIPKYIAAADLVVLPFSYAPTTSRSLLEAMALAKPIITVPYGEIPQILKNEKEAILVNPKPKEIAEAIKRVIEDKKLCQRIGYNALKIVEKNYSLEKIIKKTIGTYRNLLIKK